MLVDGGLINPIPIEPTAAASADLTIAISCRGCAPRGAARRPGQGVLEPVPREEWDNPPAPQRHRGARVRAGPGHHEPVRGHARDLDHNQTIPPEALDDLPQTPADALVVRSADVGLLDLLNMSFETMSALISRYRMASNPPDVLVTVPSNAVRTLDFHRAAEMIELGRQLTTEPSTTRATDPGCDAAVVMLRMILIRWVITPPTAAPSRASSRTSSRRCQCRGPRLSLWFLLHAVADAFLASVPPPRLPSRLEVLVRYDDGALVLERDGSSTDPTLDARRPAERRGAPARAHGIRAGRARRHHGRRDAAGPLPAPA